MRWIPAPWRDRVDERALLSGCRSMRSEGDGIKSIADALCGVPVERARNGGVAVSTLRQRAKQRTNRAGDSHH
jgi:hypothetical protein